MKEIESKVLSISPADVRKRLRELHATLEKDVLQHNEGYVSKAHPKIWARIRIEGENAFFTIKGQSKRVKGMKIVDEHELVIDDPQVMREMLAVLGFKLKSVRELRREYWKLHGCTVEICRIPGVPPYLEIEGSKSEIKRVGALLGFGPERLDARGIGKIYSLPDFITFKNEK